MSFAEERLSFEQELDRYYARYPTDLSVLEDALHAESAGQAAWTPYQRKNYGYAVLAARCPVHVFRYCPFYFEFDTGHARTSLGGDGIGAWMKNEPFGRELSARGWQWWQACSESGLSIGWPVLDDNHHCIGNDNVFRYGLNGLIRTAEARLQTAVADEERDFLQSTIAGNRALIAIAARFAVEAERVLATEDDPVIRYRLQRIADTARRVPAEPPATFYEALNTLLFMREVGQWLEGNGTSIIGHLDRILYPFYARDLAAGRLTRAEADDLLRAALAIFDTRFGIRHVSEHYGTNTTVVIGGCERDGTPVFNKLTAMIADAYRELRLVDPKLNARISAAHPPAYFRLLADLTAAGCNSLAIFNDDVIIAANVKMGKAEEDCRQYVGGGCQENLLENTEINSRATIYLNLAQILLMGFFPQRWAWFAEREGVVITPYAECATFDDLYQIFLRNVQVVHDAHVEQRNRTEREGVRFNPCPLQSATMDDCLARARDMMAGGARYSFGSVSLTGAGTVIDALSAIREVVYTRPRVSLTRLAEILADNFAGEEALRRFLRRDTGKFGHEEEAMYAFSARVFADLARVTRGKPNTRGGCYEASLFSFRLFTNLGYGTGATPDGRKAGEFLSPGMSPSLPALGAESSIGQVLNAVAAVDLTAYPVVAVLDVKLPIVPTGGGAEVIVPVLRRFLSAGGSVLQLNLLDQQALLDARAHPERYPDLVVRVSGYSAYFAILPEQVQDEVIERAMVRA